MNLLSYSRINSALMRRLLSAIYQDGKVYRVPMGPLKGMRLHYDRSVNFHAILGLWDIEALSFLRKVLTDGGYLRDGLVIADVGANLGIYSLWFARLLRGRRPRIVAFEPAPETLGKLRINVAANAPDLVQIVPMACADREGSMAFFAGHHHHASSLIREWAQPESPAGAESVQIETTTLDAFFHAPDRGSPDFIKMDIEGGGIVALKGCHRIFATKRPLVWIESHLPDEDRAISHVLTTHSYCAYRFDNRRAVVHPNETHPDPDGVWGTMLLYPAENASRIEKTLR
jgi:FkbM family methyltransferase